MRLRTVESWAGLLIGLSLSTVGMALVMLDTFMLLGWQRDRILNKPLYVVQYANDPPKQFLSVRLIHRSVLTSTFGAVAHL